MNSTFIKRVMSKVGSKRKGKKLQISQGTKTIHDNWEKARSPPLGPATSETNGILAEKKEKPIESKKKAQMNIKPSTSSNQMHSLKSAREFLERTLTRHQEKPLKHEKPLNKMRKDKLKAKLDLAKAKKKKQKKSAKSKLTTDAVVARADADSDENGIDQLKQPECASDVDVISEEEKEIELPEREEVKPEEGTQMEHQLVYSSESCVKYSDTADGKAVVIPNGKSIHFQGILELKVLIGRVDVLGYEIGPNSGTFRLYSPRGTSFLYVRNVANKGAATVLCSKVEDTHMRFIEKHVSQQILPEKRDHFQLKFEPQGNLVRINPEWNKLINTITNNTKLLVVGGKSVGKSTFIRYAINKLLLSYESVRIIDLDPGQAEFTVPGSVSVVIVKEPLLGPNYTHLKKTESTILSNISPGYDPMKYVENVKCLCETLDSREIPTLINYMGYSSEMGVDIASAVISIVMPTDIVEIYSKNTKKNFTTSFEDPSSVLENTTLLENNVTELTYSYHRLQSMCDQNDAWSAEPRVLREMCILSYFGQMLSSKSILSTKLPLYEINLHEIIPVDAAGQSLPLEVLNSALVALCSTVQDGIFKCHGWGIVRGVDRNSNIAVILTPEKPQILDDVTHLVYDELALPPSIYMTPDGNIGHISYVISGELQDFGKITKRSYKPVGRK